MTEAWGLEGRNMVLLYSVQNAFGTAVTPATPFGIASFEDDVPSGIRAIFGLGSADALFIKEGMSVPTARISNLLVQSSAFLTDFCNRSSGVLPWVTIGAGWKDDDGTRYARQIQDCKLASLDLRLEGSQDGGLLVAGLEFTGRKPTDITTLDPHNLETAPLAHYEAILTKGGAAWESDTFALQLNENLRPKFPIPGAAPTAGEERLWKYLKEGRRDVSGDIGRASRSQIDMLDSPMSDFAIQLVATDADGGSPANAVTIAIAGAKFGGERHSGGPDQEFSVSNPFIAKTATFS